MRFEPLLPLRQFSVDGRVELLEVCLEELGRGRIDLPEMIRDLAGDDLGVEWIEEKVRIAERMDVAFGSVEGTGLFENEM